MKHDHRSGFTLIEIIIVIIILGILAAVALPQITKNLETAKAAEAINILGAANKSVSDCYTITEDMTKCSGFNNGVSFLDMQLKPPVGTVTNPLRFSYTWTAAASPTDTVKLKATSISVAADTIEFTYHTDGSVDKTFAGHFAQLNK